MAPGVRTSAIDEDFLQPSQAFQNERHGSDSHIAQRLKYFEITEKLYHLPFTIQNLQSLPYLERYTFLYEQHPIVIDLYYKGSGIFNVLAPDPANPIKNQLIEVLNAPFHYPITVDYEPSNERLEYLYQKVNACCNELDITICNIKEHIGNYYVIYYLLTDGRFSYIQFYFNKKGLSTANPKSDLGPNDNKLNQLIELLSK